ncbi:gamma-butyrobetaine hydroxylase-like domain-containing protein [Pseudoduganella sp. UC29_106]|uniref:gamma-butyrobetaine hydroxylase-like domain-containing protein n=1 Tax=Pseudoduganella sp. UC29_106 TaxID=3374553 RepID=UPI003757DD0F
MPNPTGLTLHNKSRYLEISFDDGASFNIPYELLRVYSPSAEVKGHGPGQEVLQVGKREVGMSDLEPVGNYAVKPTFTDGHNSGLYTWDYLYDLGARQDHHWADYRARLEAAGFPGDTGREPGTELPGAPKAHGCGHHH